MSSETDILSVKFDNLGIVVIGRNEGPRLIDCLTSLKKCTNRIVYVDSGSTDGSAETADKSGAFVVRLDTAHPFTAARARNEGFAALLKLERNTKFVQFIDGDCELVMTWIDICLAFITDKKDVAVVCGRRRERYPERSVYNYLCNIEWNSPIGEALACGGDSMVRVEAFAEVGGFYSELIAGEEPELCARLRQKGWRVWRLDAEMTRHDAAIMHFSQWWLRAVRSGYAEAEISWLHRAAGSTGEQQRVASAMVWGGLLPLFIGVGAFFHPSVLAVMLIYPLQIARIAAGRSAKRRDSWIYALFMTVAKFAQLQGILKFCWNRWRSKETRLIEYKKLD